MESCLRPAARSDSAMEVNLDPYIDSIYETSTATWQHVVCDPSSRSAVIIDPVLDNKTVSCGTAPISTLAADQILEIVQERDYKVDRILETHAGNHRSAAWYLRTQIRERTGTTPRVAMGENVKGFRRQLQRKYAIESYDLQCAFDSDHVDGEIIAVGDLEARVFRVTGTSLERVGYVIGRNVFAGALTTASWYTKYGRSEAEVEPAVIEQLGQFPSEFRLFGAEVNAAGQDSLPCYQPPPSTSIGNFCSWHGPVVEDMDAF